MHISGEAIIIKVKPQSRGTFLVNLFSEKSGKISGLVRGGHKKNADLQLGNIVEFEQTKRLESQLGSLRVELLFAPSANLFSSANAMQVLQYMCELFMFSLAEGESHPRLYNSSKEFLKKMDEKNIWENLGLFELSFLSSIGYGLSLDEGSAVREEGDNSPLIYVSPKSGRAVSEQAGKPYKDKILALPSIFGGKSKDLLDVFALTGHFLDIALEGRPLKGRAELMRSVREQIK